MILLNGYWINGAVQRKRRKDLIDMKIEVRPPEGVMIIGEKLREYTMFHLYCDDGLENGILIILTKEQMQTLKKDINNRKELDYGVNWRVQMLNGSDIGTPKKWAFHGMIIYGQM